MKLIPNVEHQLDERQLRRLHEASHKALELTMYVAMAAAWVLIYFDEHLAATSLMIAILFVGFSRRYFLSRMKVADEMDEAMEHALHQMSLLQHAGVVLAIFGLGVLLAMRDGPLDWGDVVQTLAFALLVAFGSTFAWRIMARARAAERIKRAAQDERMP